MLTPFHPLSYETEFDRALAAFDSDTEHSETPSPKSETESVFKYSQTSTPEDRTEIVLVHPTPAMIKAHAALLKKKLAEARSKDERDEILVAKKIADNERVRLSKADKALSISVAIVVGVVFIPIAAVAGAIIAPVGLPMMVLDQVQHEARSTKDRKINLDQKGMRRRRRIAMSVTVVGGIVCAPLSAVVGAAIVPIAMTKKFAKASTSRKVKNPFAIKVASEKV